MALRPQPVRRLRLEVRGKEQLRRVFVVKQLRGLFPGGVLARWGRGSQSRFCWFVRPSPPPDECLFWDVWAASASLEHGGVVAPLVFGWGVFTAAGWEHIG